MQGTSDTAQHGPNQETPAGAAPGCAPEEREPEARDPQHPPVIESPPTSPPSSPWWTAPGGKAVSIPDFGHVMFGALFDALIALLAPAPRPIPVRIRAKK